MDCFRLRQGFGGQVAELAMTWIHLRILAARCARGLLEFLHPLRTEGAGNAGCALHPRSRVQCAQKSAHTSIQGSGEHPTFPAQWLYGLSRALPGERLFCLRRPSEALASSELDASTATSGPHVFAVRISHARQSQLPRPPHPRPSFVTTADAPLVGTGWR